MSVVKRFGPGLVLAVVLAVGLGLAVNRWAPSDQPQPANLPLPSVDEIVSAHVNLYPIQTSYPAPLDPTNPRDRELLISLLGLLQRSAKASGKTDHSLEHNTSLTLTLNGGGQIQVGQAMDCTEYTNGWSCTLDVNDVVVWHGTNGDRVRSPEFGVWLAGAWAQNMPRVPGRTAP